LVNSDKGSMKPGQLQWVVTFLMLFLFSTSTTVLCCVLAPSGLMGWWPAEGDANDVAGTNNGTLVNGAGFTTGEVGQAFSFDGVSSYVSIPDSPSLDSFTTRITIEAWIKSNRTNAYWNWQGIICKGSSSWRLQARAGATTVAFSATGVSPNGDLYGSRNVYDDQWHHVAGVYDGINMFLYVDGTLDVSQPATGSISLNSDPMCIGANGNGYFFDGLVDEVSIYNRALTASEIQSIYSAGISGKCPLGAPVIISQPTNQTVVAGYTASFSVMASGALPLSYQWQFNGTNIDGATNSILALTNVKPAGAGSYTVTVTNRLGSLTSSNAVLTVLAIPPTIVSQPTNQTVMVGNTASFSVMAVGSPPLSYNWFFNGFALSDGGRIVGSTTSTLLISNVQTNDSGLYQVVVTNNYGTITSAVASLAEKVQIISQPSSLAVLRGSNAAFTVTAIGTLPLGYQWYFNGTPLTDGGRISGSASPMLNILNVQDGDYGGYAVTVTNLCSSATSSTALLILPLVRYVNLNNTNPISPYTNWATAATSIQDAVDAANSLGDTILVTNGVYNTGSKPASDGSTSRVSVTNSVTLQSVNGPTVTRIDGGQAMRCVYLTDGAVLAGFTLTNGVASVYGGGVMCDSVGAVVTNCVLVGNSAFNGGGASYGTLNNCTLTGNNSTRYGGGASYGTLNNCTLTGNSASWHGGGAFSGTLNNCTLTSNSASWYGGGAKDCTLSNCTLTGNLAYHDGGGAFSGTLNNCTLTGNSAYYNGGGAYPGTLNNCTLAGNSANYGGGAYFGTLNNCTLTGNSASLYGGGAYSSTLNNCVVCYNTAPSGLNYQGGTLNFCCTTPMPTNGSGNISLDPQLASASHLSTGSPCRGVGSPSYASGVDIDGEAWADPPSIGCDEYHAGALTGQLSVTIVASYTNVATGFDVNFTAQIGGRLGASRWDFGDDTVVSNRPYAFHSWAAAGNYTVTLTAYNESHPEGISATVVIYVEQLGHYVALTSTNPNPPYTSWATAATNIQDAVDAAYAGGTVVVSNGVHKTGGRVTYGALTNRVAVTKPLTVQSVNGPAVTVIKGYQVSGTTNGAGAVRCVYLTNGAVLAGFTLTNGATLSSGDSLRECSGGGVWCETVGAVVSNCVLVGNSASSCGGGATYGTLNYCTLTGNSVQLYGGGIGGGATFSMLNNCTLTGNSAWHGGGACSNTLNNCTLSNNWSHNGGAAYGGVLNNCTLAGNSADSSGGAAYSMLNNCTLTGNSAGYGGGTSSSRLNNCIVYYNSATQQLESSNYTDSTVMSNCDTAPLPSGFGNITNEPNFVSLAGGDFHLQSNSPCINSGNNAYVTVTNDLDGNPRIRGGTVDIGAYEFQSPASVISYAWLQQYGLTNNGSADYVDSDGDHLNNWQEWQAGTVPTNALSVLRLSSPVRNGSGLVVTWQSVSTRAYFIERSSNLSVPGSFLTLATNIAGQPGTTSFTDTYALGSGPFFYRVGIWTSAYQVRTAASIIPFTWLQQYNLPTDGSVDFVDTDRDGMNNWQEWIAGTDPTDHSSVLKMLAPASTNNPSGLVVTWQSVNTRTYYLQRSTNLGAQPPFSTIQTNIAGQAGTTSYKDTTATNGGPYFYRVGVQ